MIYGTIITFAIVLTIFYNEKLVKDKNLNTEIYWNTVFWSLLMGLIGGRIYHVIELWNFYKLNPTAIFNITNGGMVIFGSLIFGGVTGVIILKKHKQNIMEWFDIFTLTLPLAQSMGRWANVLNKELLPFAIYESILDLGLFIILFLISKHTSKKGLITHLYLIGYATIRLILEPLRPNNWVFNFQGYQIIVAQVLTFLIILITTGSLWKNLKVKN